MKKVCLLLLMASPKFLPAQDDGTANRKIITRDFGSLSTSSRLGLIPFVRQGKTGYLDKSGNIIVTPKYGSAGFFNPAMSNGALGDTEFYIDSIGRIITGMEAPENNISEATKMEENDDPIIFRSAKEGHRGFSLNEFNGLKSISDIYRSSWYYYFKLLLIQKKQYAIIYKGGKFGIIDTAGNTLPGFDFVHKKIMINRYAKDPNHTWFFVKNDEGVWSFQNELGEIKFNKAIWHYHYIWQGNQWRNQLRFI
jgi:hypothetical protein